MMHNQRANESMLRLEQISRQAKQPSATLKLDGRFSTLAAELEAGKATIMAVEVFALFEAALRRCYLTSELLTHILKEHQK